MRIAIVNDMRTAVEALRRVLMSTQRHEVAWVAFDGADAVEQCSRDKPDLILMDLMMPVMSGAEAIRNIMVQTPCAILVVTGSVGNHSKTIFEALGAGALDAVQTPTLTPGNEVRGGAALIVKIDAIARMISKDATQIDGLGGTQAAKAAAAQRLVVIGASAGGPGAIATILRQIPEDFPAAIILVQHIDAQFAPLMAKWLDEQSRVPVRIARDGECLQERTVLIAGSEHHLVLRSSQALGYSAEPRDSYYRPSIDVFFHSVRRLWKGQLAGVLLTGMGRDGAAGLKALREAGAFTVTQDRASSVVYGMPKAAAELDAASEIIALERIGPRLLTLFTNQTR